MIGEAKATGAISVVNAIACGKGASIAVKLPTVAKVEVRETRGRWRAYLNGREAKSSLAIHTVRRAIRMLGNDPERYSGTVETVTSTPVGVGLKTSSSSSVAMALAVFSAFGKKRYVAQDVLRCSVSASLAAGVSVTGAMDDAASCLLGGVNLADNSNRKVISSVRLGRTMTVLIRIPKDRSRRASVGPSYVRKFSGVAESIFTIGRAGKIWKAMTLNGLLYCSIYGYPPFDTLQALEANAVGAGLSGTGPAVGAVFGDQGEAERLARSWSKGGAKLIRTETSDGGATIGI